MLTMLLSRKLDPWTTLVRDWDDLLGSMPASRRLLGELERPVLMPAIDVGETDDHYLLSLDVPGVHRDDLHIEVVGDRLSISGEWKEDSQNGSRRSGKFSRTVSLPDGVTADGVEAEYKDGVLRLSVRKPVAVSAKPTKIAIGDGSASGSSDGSRSGFLRNLVGDRKPKETVSVKAVRDDDAALPRSSCCGG